MASSSAVSYVQTAGIQVSTCCSTISGWHVSVHICLHQMSKTCIRGNQNSWSCQGRFLWFWSPTEAFLPHTKRHYIHVLMSIIIAMPSSSCFYIKVFGSYWHVSVLGHGGVWPNRRHLGPQKWWYRITRFRLWVGKPLGSSGYLKLFGCYECFSFSVKTCAPISKKLSFGGS